MNLFQKQQNSSGYDSIPKAIATDDATAAAVPFVMTLGQRSKRMVVIAAGLLLVTGGAAVWLQQEEGSYFRSSGGSLATEDGSITTDVMLAELGSETIALQEELALTLLDEQSSSAGCTEENLDPWSTGQHVDCCSNLDEVKGNWKPTGEPSYRCVNSTPTPTSDSLCSDVVCEAKEVIFSGDDKKYACGNPANTTGNTLVCYPRKGKPKHHLPVVFYNRDSGGWTESDPYYSNKGNRAWLTTMAEQCLITIAPMTLQHNPPTNKCKHDHDSFLAFDFLLKNQNNWNVTWGIKDVTPDWKRIAVAGQSSGAHHLPSLQMLMGGEPYNKRMKAVLYGHGGSLESDKPKYKPDLNECLKSKDKWCDDIPAMFLTATNDNDVPNERTFHWYQKLTHPRTGVDDTGVDGSKKVPVTNAVYAQVPGKHDENNHMEPIYPDGGAFNDYAARFLACHLYKGAKDKKSSTRSLEACAWIYGGNGKLNICNSTEVKDLVDTGGVNGKKGRHLVYDGRKMC